jgi:hypothetical protein
MWTIWNGDYKLKGDRWLRHNSNIPMRNSNANWSYTWRKYGSGCNCRVDPLITVSDDIQSNNPAPIVQSFFHSKTRRTPNFDLSMIKQAFVRLYRQHISDKFSKLSSWSWKTQMWIVIVKWMEMLQDLLKRLLFQRSSNIDFSHCCAFCAMTYKNRSCWVSLPSDEMEFDRLPLKRYHEARFSPNDL